MRKLMLFLTLVMSVIFLGATFSIAENAHTDHTMHSSANTKAQITTPTEPGQSAFAAIAEIVEILESDPNTDWSLVNIEALRTHLIDMESLTTESVVNTQQVDGHIIFEVTDTPAAVDSARRMVPAHASELREKYGWDIETKVLDDRVQMTVQSTDDLPLEKLNALGFFGIMTTGAHHQPHHLGIAKGSMVH